MKFLPLLLIALLVGCKSDTKKISSSEATNTKSNVHTATEAASTTKITEVGNYTEAVDKATVDIESQVQEGAIATKNQVETIVKDKTKVNIDVAEETKATTTKVVPKPSTKVENTVSEVKEKVKTATKSVPKPVEKVPEKIEQVPTEKVATKTVPKPTKPISQESVGAVESVPTKRAAKITHADFDKLLSKYVSASGKVNYSGFKSKVGKLDAYITQLQAVNVATLNKKEQLAFWINAYNAFTIKKIVNNYPLKSITDLDGGKPWDTKWIELNGKTLSLNNIENDIIRPQFNEPRIHFAVNCAAKSCPPLLNKAWTASNLESNFASTSKAFINSSQNNLTADKAQLSKIFDWYGVDFGDIITFVNKYSKVKVNAGAAVEYLEYDWSLNE